MYSKDSSPSLPHQPRLQNMPHTALTATAAFQALLSHHAEVRERHMRDLFAADAGRFDHMTVKAAGILLDYSKNRVDNTTLKLLFELARERVWKAAAPTCSVVKRSTSPNTARFCTPPCVHPALRRWW